MRIVSGKFRGTHLFSPKGESVRPTSEQLRGSVFNICRETIENAQVLDLFAGSGAIGFEALSRGASFVTFIEQDKHALACIKKNIEKLNVQEYCKVFSSEACLSLKRFSSQKKQFSHIYIDPPYSKEEGLTLADKALSLVDEYKLLAPNGILFVEKKIRKGDEEPKLSSLKLISSRTFGSTLLLEYGST